MDLEVAFPAEVKPLSLGSLEPPNRVGNVLASTFILGITCPATSKASPLLIALYLLTCVNFRPFTSSRLKTRWFCIVSKDPSLLGSNPGLTPAPNASLKSSSTASVFAF